MKISIVMPTYRESDDLGYLEKSLSSLFNQTHLDFKLYLIGDRFEGEQDLLNLISKFDNKKIHFKNLEVAQERDFYEDKSALWLYGGINATNEGIEISLTEDNNYICHLDHDDYWDPNHLELINKCITETGSDWMCTKARYTRNGTFIIDTVLPLVESNDEFVNFLPMPHGVVRSSVCVNFKNIPLRYRDIYKETGNLGLPSDADLLQRSSDFIKENNLKSTLINTITCHSC